MGDESIRISLPEHCLVVLIGASGSGKSTFARDHFLPTEVLSSDYFRGLVSDDENDLAATNDAFEALHFVAAKRLGGLKLTVVDATNVQAFARKPLLDLARQFHLLPIAIVLDLPERACRQRNQLGPDRNFGSHVIGQQCRQLRQSLNKLKKEGFRRVHVLRCEEDVAGVHVEREKVWNNRKEESGPFDIIGDVHGCYEELTMLLEKLGYSLQDDRVVPPAGRKALFVGDLVDRGPDVAAVLRLVMGMVTAGTALCVPGNHDVRLVRALQGKNVKQTHGLLESMQQFSAEEPAFLKEVSEFIDSLVSHYVLDEGKLVLAHAGMKQELAGRTSGAVRQFALYGETTGETDEFGLPVRHDWASEYRGEALVAYGHTPMPEPEWLNNTINLDTGCVFGGSLTALRYPERELISVAALRVYIEPIKPLSPAQAETTEPRPSAQQQHDDVLDLSDVLGKRIVRTRLLPSVTIREDQSIPALEVMSRFTIDPRWLVYQPPTMSPPETSTLPDYLEHPAEALAYYRSNGIEHVLCEEKHMGSRACLIVCRDSGSASRRFGTGGDRAGVCYTRTGRRFFIDDHLEAAFLERIRQAVANAGLWEELNTDWMLLDCELLPWSARGAQLLQDQYAAVGAAAGASLAASIDSLKLASENGVDVESWLETYQERHERITRYVEVYRNFCWPVTELIGLKLAPFHLLASAGAVHESKNHHWHLDMLARLSTADPEIIMSTDHRAVDLGNESACRAVTSWWEEKTAAGSEGMVVKPLDFVAQGDKGLLQPAIKCRGREYLRLIYGPEYTTPDSLQSLRRRNLRTKRQLALREFALGLEGLERFVERQPLRRVHECVFGVLAMESEPVDPRL